MQVKPWLALFLAAGCVDHPHGNPQITDPDSVGTPLPAAILEHSKGDGDHQPGVLGLPLRQRLLVRVTREGTAVPGILVKWITGEPGAVLNPSQGVSDVFGIVTTSYTVGNRPITQHVLATILHDTLDYQIFAVGPNQTETGAAIFQGQGPTLSSSVVMGAQVLDLWNEPVAFRPVYWSLQAGAGTLSDSVSVTDASGQAFITLTLTTDPDTVVVDASTEHGGSEVTVTLH